MKILAQHGFGPKDKLSLALEEDILEGVILSPRYAPPGRMSDLLEELGKYGNPVYFDPEYYATDYCGHPMANLGSLEAWTSYFYPSVRHHLILGTSVDRIIMDAFEAQKGLGLRTWIAPNVYVPKADSIEAGIALQFITKAKKQAEELGGGTAFATLAIDRQAMLNARDFKDILRALTSLDTPPDGYYVLVGSDVPRDPGGQVRSDLDHPDVIAGWMYVNYVLSINGWNVINGYCHLLSPLLGAAGAHACASGWFSGLRTFSMRKYLRGPAGGRAPLIHYVSTPLMARVRQTDLEAFMEVVPEVQSDTPLDSVYLSGEVSRTEEAIQSWEALRKLSGMFCTGNVGSDLERLAVHLKRAAELWTELQEAGFSSQIEANLERIEAMRQGIRRFTEWAEID